MGSEQYARRPYVIVSRTAINRSGKTIVGVPLSTSESAKAYTQPPYRILIPHFQIIKDVSYSREIQDCIAKTDHVRVLDKTRLENRMGKLTNSAIASVGLGLMFLLDR